jgi:hypothetical protein
MKAFRARLILLALTFLLLPAALYCAEVTAQQDIAIFGVTSYAFDIPGEVLGYADTSIDNVFVNLKRFNVLGFGNYRIESQDIEDFIARVREARSEKAKEAGTYDEKFGTLVIKGEDFDRIANSFLVVAPSLSNYTWTVRREERSFGLSTYVKREYTVDIVMDLAFLNVREGRQEEAVRVNGTASNESLDRASRQAVDSAVSSLSLKIRQLEAFKIKSGIIRVKGDTVYFELGKNIGVKPGDEFEVLTRQEVGKTGRIVELPTGLVRVRKVYPETTEARIVYQSERITEGDQLAEAANAGVQLSFQAGVMQVDIPDMEYNITVVDDANTVLPPPITDNFEVNLDQKQRNLSPVVALLVEKSLGYRFKGIFEGTALLNFPLFAGIGELGAGAVFQKRRLSLDLAVSGGVLYMTTFQQRLRKNGLLNIISIEGTKIDFDDEPIMNIWGLSAGVKGSAGLTFLIKPRFALNAGVSYRLYTPIRNWKIRVAETAGSDKASVSIDSDSPNIVENPGSGKMKQVKLSGLEFTLALTSRF